MYDELVKRLRNCATQAAPCKTCDLIEDGSCSDTLMKQAADAIEELSKLVDESIPKADAEIIIAEVAKPRWIPVTERLPKNGVPILICGDGNVVEQGFFDDEYGYWYDWGGNRTFVHHWMPLPEPPKEET